MTTTITTTSEEDQRISVAFGTYLFLGRNANAAEVKADIADYIRKVVRTQEHNAAVAAVTDQPPIMPT